MKSLVTVVGLRSLAAIVLICCTLPTCTETEPQCEEFLRLDIPQRRSNFEKHSLYEQVDLFVCAILNIHPTDFGLADSLASKGKVVVPLLLERIESEPEELVKVELLQVFVLMQEGAYYDVNSDEATMRVLERVVSVLSDPMNEEGVGLLNELKDPSHIHQ
jgi:hypothetical protein